MQFFEISKYDVKVGKSKIKIYNRYTKQVFKITKFQKVFIGDDYDYEADKFYSFSEGNTILIKAKYNQYVLINDAIYGFFTEDEILKFASPIASKGISCPYAIGERFSYFFFSDFIEKIPNQMLDINAMNLLDQYYKLNFDKQTRKIVDLFNIKAKVLDKL